MGTPAVCDEEHIDFTLMVLLFSGNHVHMAAKIVWSSEETQTVACFTYEDLAVSHMLIQQRRSQTLLSRSVRVLLDVFGRPDAAVLFSFVKG